MHLRRGSFLDVNSPFQVRERVLISANNIFTRVGIDQGGLKGLICRRVELERVAN